MPGAHKVPNTNFYRAPEHGDDLKAFGRWAADRIEEAIEFEGPDTVAAVFLEPVQNSGGCFPPPPGYFERVREICDEYDVLLVSDEVDLRVRPDRRTIFACNDFGYVPDIITCAKGMTSGYSPIGAMIATDRIMEPFLQGHHVRSPHGYTFGGHPVSAAVALANLDIFEREGLNDHVLENEAARSGRPSRSCSTCRSSATSAATGTSTASSWSRTRRPARRSTTTSPSGCCAGSCPRRCSTPGSTAAPTTAATRSIQLAPPLICDQSQFDEMEQILRVVLTEAWARLVTHRQPAARTQVRRLPEKQVARPRGARRGARRRPGRARRGRRRRRPAVRPAGRLSPATATRVLFHGSTATRLFRALAAGAPTCLTVTAARRAGAGPSPFESSMHYRSAMVLGRCTAARRRGEAARRWSHDRAPDARAVGRRAGRPTARSSPRRRCSRCRSTSGR